jgi:hypothetical protein
MGGTGANFIGLVTGDAAFYNLDGNPATPPNDFTYTYGNPPVSVEASQIENPNPQPGLSNSNWYTEDGYRRGSYVKCSDSGQPGVTPIRDYLKTLNIPPNCAPDTYYLVNNYNLGYKANGDLFNPSNDPTKFTLPSQPSTFPTIADALTAKGVSWKYYSGGRGDGTSTPSRTTADIAGFVIR